MHRIKKAGIFIFMNEQAKILHIETSTEICSMAISTADIVLAECSSQSGYEHSAKGTLLVKECLEKAGIGMNDLAAVSISEGPGSYTGLRVGFAMAKGFCYAHNLDLITVPTLDALAYDVKEKYGSAIVSPMLDARRMEVYTASFDKACTMVSSLEAIVLDEEVFQNYYGANDVNVFIGDGAHKVSPWLRSGQDTIVEKYCSAADQRILAHLSYVKKAFSDIAYAVPLYLKSPNITVSKKNLLL